MSSDEATIWLHSTKLLRPKKGENLRLIDFVRYWADSKKNKKNQV